MPIHQMPPRCYIVANGYPRPPQTALTLWNDTIDSDQTGPHVMLKSAERDVPPEVVATFSGIPNTVACIERRHLGEYWVIKRSP
jgi:hypothetical protein